MVDVMHSVWLEMAGNAGRGRCQCGWDGAIRRTQREAADDADKHIVECRAKGLSVPVSDSEVADAVAGLLEMRKDFEMTDPGHITAGVWRHAKGNHYLVLGVAADSNNVDPHAEPQVVYVSLEGYGLPGPRMHFRSMSEFKKRFTPA